MNASKTARLFLTLAVIALFAAIGLGASVQAAAAAPVLQVQSTHLPSSATSPKAPRPGLPLGGLAKYILAVSNSGDAATSAPVSVSFNLPAGLKATAVTSEKVGGSFVAWTCSIAADSRSINCAGPEVAGMPLPINPGQQACQPLGQCRILVTAAPDPGLRVGEVLTPTVEACGGGAAGCATASDPIEVVPHFEITNFDGGVFEGNVNPISPGNYDPVIEQSGEPETQAGAHPESASTTFMLTQTATLSGHVYATGDLDEVSVDLPAGFLANVNAAPTCAEADLSNGTNAPACPIGSQVGLVAIYSTNTTKPGELLRAYVPLFNMDPPEGRAALLGFNFQSAVYHLVGGLRRDPGVAGGYRASVKLLHSPQTVALWGSAVTVWGVPASSSHDIQRGIRFDGESCVSSEGTGVACPAPIPSPAPKKPFVSLPTSCEGPVRTEIAVTTLQGDKAKSSFLSHDNTSPIPNPIGADGCNALDFSPTLEARPTTNVADSPSGLDVNLHIPQNENPAGLATAHLKDTVVDPAGGGDDQSIGCQRPRRVLARPDRPGQAKTPPGVLTPPSSARWRWRHATARPSGQRRRLHRRPL